MAVFLDCRLPGGGLLFPDGHPPPGDVREVTLTLDPVVPAAQPLPPYASVAADGGPAAAESVADALDSLLPAARVSPVDADSDGTTLYRFDWTGDADTERDADSEAVAEPDADTDADGDTDAARIAERPVLSALAETNAAVLEATLDDWTWSLRVRFDGPDDAQRFQESAADRDASLSVEKLVTRERRSDDDVVSSKQWATLREAYSRGYFETPRGCALRDLADEFDVSTQAVSQRLRRGVGNLVVEHHERRQGPDS
ncbi:helix-turn-helix domain-containing protein [Halobaculum sp. P14]|uniref:helix-turn-helix domain-containing protein n=1 Tax=Halobaculum sp. P14 TaxID=3421638 RepID=UPI003EBED97A